MSIRQSFSKILLAVAIIFLGIGFITHGVLAAPLAPTSTSVSAITTSTATYGWAWGGGTETFYAVASSTNGVSFTGDPVVILSTSTLSYGFTGLDVNTRYWLVVFSGESTSTFSSMATSSPFYTLAKPASAPTTGTVTSSTIPLTINVNGNPANTVYAIYNTTTSRFLDSTGAATTSAVYQATSTWGTSLAAVGLTPNTAYQFVVVARNGDGVNAATSSASTAVRTLAEANAPTTGTVTTSTIPLTINTGSNPAATTYAIYNYTLDNYLDASGTATTTAVFQTTSTWDVFAAVGLTPNTSYQFKVVSKNGSDVVATSSASTAIYTLAVEPASISAIVNNTSQITVSWSNGSTQYYAENTTTGDNSGWISSTGYTFSGLRCGTSYTFKVKGENGDSVPTDWSGSVSATTNSCGVALGGGGGGYYWNPVTPTVSSSPVVENSPVAPITYYVPGLVAPVVTPVATPVTKSVNKFIFKRTLYPGSRSNDVKELQVLLKSLGYFSYPTFTTYYGPATKAAVVKFQKANNLKPYPGWVGPGTLKALNSIVK